MNDGPIVTALNPLQKAYLLGRTTSYPLGGTSMHDFREFRGRVDADELQQSIRLLEQKYPALRILIDEERLVQSVAQQHFEHFERIDLSGMEYQRALDRLDALRETLSNRMLPLDRPPWFIWLVQLPENPDFVSVVFSSFDGLILDGYSIAKLLKDLFSSRKIDLRDSNEYIGLEQSPFFSSQEKDKAFWLGRLSSIHSVTELPWQMELESIFEPEHKRQSLVINGKTWKKISTVGARHRLLPNTLLTATIFEVLSLWAKDRHLLVSLPVSNSALLRRPGNHSSFIVVDYSHQMAAGFMERSMLLQKDILEAMGHLSFSGLEIAKHLIRKVSRPIALPVALTNGLSWGEQFESEHLRYAAGITRTPQLALDMRLTLSANSDLVIDFDYVEQALSSSLIADILQAVEQRFMQLGESDSLDGLAEFTGNSAENHEIDSSEPRQWRLDDYLGKIERNIFSDPPDKAAMIFAGQPVSYAELGRHVARLMAAFSEAGLGRGSVVAICLPKSPEHVHVALACSLSGIVWVPIDMDSPASRIEYLLRNCRAEVAVSFAPVDGIRHLDIKDLLSSTAISGGVDSQYVINRAAAYYLYTSGSTGRPKCVVLNNQATANVLESTIRRWRVTADDVLMAATPFHHDMSVFDVFAALSVGATLVLPTANEAKNAVAWAKLVAAHRISLWCSVPAIVDMLLSCAGDEQLRSLRLVAQGGDYIKPSVIKRLRGVLPHARLFSLGGPTETTIWSIWHEITDADSDLIPYGKALDNNEYYILDENHQHCGNHASGNICMAGVNLSNGYLIDGQLNQEEFIRITDPSGQVRRAFKASDKGYFREDGNIVFVGREEGYLKVRGVRISSAEVENALSKYHSIHDAVVLACANPAYEENELVALYTVENASEDINVSELRRFLRTQLPDSHIPSRWLAIATLPLTANAKVDRKALQKMAEERVYAHYGQSAANENNRQKTLEDSVLDLFRQYASPVHDLDSIWADTEILTLGIRPTHLRQMASHLSRQLNVQIDLHSLAKCRTIRDVVGFMEEYADTPINTLRVGK